MNLTEQLKEAEQKVIDIKNKINKPRMEFDFVKWCINTLNDSWLVGQDLIKYNIISEKYYACKAVNNHHLAEKIITWQIAKYIEKYDKGWKPDFNQYHENICFFFLENNVIKIDTSDRYSCQTLPNTFYFSEKVAEKIKDLPKILECEYGVCIFKYWLTGVR
jgi:hypothetical protein